MRWLVAPIILALASPLMAETLTFESDAQVIIVRGKDNSIGAAFEFIGAPGAYSQCIALDGSDRPVATTTAMSDMGEMLFDAITAAEIASVKCRKIM
ncbi:hypothetical protein [Roseivivax sp. CAU 1753]